MRTTATLKIFISILIGTLAFAAQAADLTWNTGDGTWDTDTGNTPWNPGPTYFTDGDNATFESTAGSGGTISIPVSVAPGSTTVTGALDYTFTGAGGITSGTLDKSGSGMLLLETVNTFTGAINLSGGSIRFSNANQLGNSASPINVLADAALDAYNPATGGPNVAKPMQLSPGVTITFTRSGSQPSATYSGLISGDGSLRIEKIAAPGGNAWTFNNSGNNFTGDIAVIGSHAAATFSNDGAMGGATTITVDGGTLNFGATVTGVGKTVNFLSNGTLGSSGGMFQGLVTGGFQISASNLGLDNPNNSQSATFVNTGTIRVGVPGSLGTGQLWYTSNPNNTVIFTDPVGGTYTNNLNMSSGANRTISVSNAGATINWTGTVSGTGDMVNKTGPGTFASTSWSSSNAINVNEGTFLMNAPTTANVGNVVVADGAVLGGSGMLGLGTGRSVTIESGGTLQGTLTVTGGAGVTVDDGGIVSPGDSAGTLSVSSLTLSEGSILNFDLSDPNVIGGGVNDLIAVDGDLTLDGVLNVTFLQDAVLMQPYTLFTYGTGLTDNGLEMGTGFPKSAYIDTSIFGQVNLVVIPEPASAVLLGLAGLILLRRPGGRRDGRQA